VDNLQASIKAHVLETFLPGTNESELTSTTPLIAGGILDSLATVRLVSWLEETYGIEIQAHEVSADNLDTIELIAELVQRKRGKG
jgi:acyl carrier protein